MISPNIEDRVLQSICIDELLDWLCDLIAIESLNGTDGENIAQEWVAARMSDCGLAVDKWEIDFPQLSQHPAYCAESERPRGLGIVGTAGLGQGPVLILNGHVDVVPAGDLTRWHFSPWLGTVASGRVYGRGAVDMKGGLCCALAAAKALREAGVQVKGKLLVESVIAEEDGGAGTLAAVLRGYHADGAIVMEPTALVIAPSQAGALNFRVTVPGKAAHGAMRLEGVSAIEKFIPLHQALMAFEQERNHHLTDAQYAGYPLPFALSIGSLQAGNWASSVPESLSFEGRFGIAPGEDADTARCAFERAVADAARQDAWLQQHPPQVDWWGGQFLPARTPVDHPLVQTICAAFHSVMGTPAQVMGMTYGADMRLLVNQGNTPCVLFGPGDVRNAHQPDEFIPVDDLLNATRTLAITILRFCGVK